MQLVSTIFKRWTTIDSRISVCCRTIVNLWPLCIGVCLTYVLSCKHYNPQLALRAPWFELPFRFSTYFSGPWQAFLPFFLLAYTKWYVRKIDDNMNELNHTHTFTNINMPPLLYRLNYTLTMHARTMANPSFAFGIILRKFKGSATRRCAIFV